MEKLFLTTLSVASSRGLAVLLCAGLMGSARVTLAQVASQPPVITRDAARHATVRAVRLSEPLRVDGVLDEPVYREVPPIDDFIQSLPVEGGQPSERTEAWVTFDAAAIYISARCWDAAPPSKWVANEMRRDSQRIGDQDGFAVALDTFHDHRNAVWFNTTPLGARMDIQITNEGNSNSDWNIVWDVRSGRFEGGWTVEIAIPFKSLRYRPGRSQTWGIQLRRMIRHKSEWAFLNPVPAQTTRTGMLRVSLGATLVGLDLPPVGTNLEIKPYAISRVATDRIQAPSKGNDLTADAGVDVKYGVTANLTADFTYNTDFAQVEVDEQDDRTDEGLVEVNGRRVMRRTASECPLNHEADDGAAHREWQRTISLRSFSRHSHAHVHTTPPTVPRRPRCSWPVSP